MLWLSGAGHTATCIVQARGLHLSQGQGGQEEDSWTGGRSIGHVDGNNDVSIEKDGKPRVKEIFLPCSLAVGAGCLLERPRELPIRERTAHMRPGSCTMWQCSLSSGYACLSEQNRSGD